MINRKVYPYPKPKNPDFKIWFKPSINIMYLLSICVALKLELSSAKNPRNLEIKYESISIEFS